MTDSASAAGAPRPLPLAASRGVALAQGRITLPGMTNVNRSDYFWLALSVAQPLMSAVKAGDTSKFKAAYDAIQTGLSNAAKLTEKWAMPEQISAELVKVGIIGSGEMSADYTDSLGTAGTSPPLAQKALRKALQATIGHSALLSGLVKLAKLIYKKTARDIRAEGFIINASGLDLPFVLEPHPFFNNCATVTGMLEPILPAGRKIANPLTNELTDCLAMQLWTIDNDEGHKGAFATVVALSTRLAGQYIGFGFGVPYAKGPERAIVWLSPSKDAHSFFDDWDHGKSGVPPPARHVSSQWGDALMAKTEKDGVTKGKFSIVYAGG